MLLLAHVCACALLFLFPRALPFDFPCGCFALLALPPPGGFVCFVFTENEVTASSHRQRVQRAGGREGGKERWRPPFPPPPRLPFYLASTLPCWLSMRSSFLILFCFCLYPSSALCFFTWLSYSNFIGECVCVHQQAVSRALLQTSEDCTQLSGDRRALGHPHVREVPPLPTKKKNIRDEQPFFSALSA